MRQKKTFNGPLGCDRPDTDLLFQTMLCHLLSPTLSPQVTTCPHYPALPYSN